MKQLFIFSLLLFPSLASAQVIDSVSTDFLSVATAEPYTATIAVYGSDLDNLLFNPVTVTLGPLTGTVTSGDDTGINLSFTIDSTLITERESSEYLTITLANTPVVNSPTSIEIFNPFVGDYVSQASRQFVEQIDHPHKRNKQNIGLNVHWAQGSDETLDDLYSKRLEDSNTVWVREHISYEQVMGSDSAAWLKRYDEVMLRYRDSNKRVVVMLAYGTGDDEFKEPDSWKNFVRLVVQRYRNYVDVWEIWNEPDSSTYLKTNNWKTYKPLLKHGSQMIREYDRDAIVLNGAIANINDHAYIRQLYTYGKNYFDELNVHLYYCDE